MSIYNPSQIAPLSWHWGLTFALAVLWCSGCTIVEPDHLLLDQEGNVGATAIQTDQTHYKARRITGDLSGVEVTIPMTFRNITEETVYFVGCLRPPMPILQKRVGDTWVTAWGGVELLCLSEPWPLAPGGTFQDTLRLSGYWPGQQASPKFETDVPGRYRLVRAVHQAPDPLAPLIPEAARLSNEFELTW